MSKYLEGMDEYDKGYMDGQNYQKSLRKMIKSDIAQIEREARISELKMLSEKFDYMEIVNKSDIKDRIKELEEE